MTFIPSIDPVSKGTNPTKRSGAKTIIAMYFCDFAVEAMPRCWIAKMININTVPITNVELKCSVPNPGIVSA